MASPRTINVRTFSLAWAAPGLVRRVVLLAALSSLGVAPVSQGAGATRHFALPLQRHETVPFVGLTIQSTNPRVAVEALRDFNTRSSEWEVTCAGGEKMGIDAESLVLERSITEVWVRIANLETETDLNGKHVRLGPYRADLGQYLVRGGKPADLSHPSLSAAPSRDRAKLFLPQNRAMHILPGNLESLNGGGGRLAPPFEIVPWNKIAGQSAVFASRDFQPGEIIFEEQAALQGNVFFDTETSTLIGFPGLCDKFEAMPEARRAQILALFSTTDSQTQEKTIRRRITKAGLEPTPERVRLYLTWIKNAWEWKEGMALADRQSHLFLNNARINHACAPNTLVQPLSSEGLLRHHAVRSIKRGEEVTDSYVGLQSWNKPFEERRSKLKGWFEACACPTCAQEMEHSRCFHCPAGCGGVCVAFRDDESIGECTGCACKLSQERAGELIKIEDELDDLRLRFPSFPADFPDLQARVSHAKKYLAPGHWLLWEADLLVEQRASGTSDLDKDLVLAIADKEPLQPAGARGWLAYGDNFESQGRYVEALYTYLRALNQMAAHDAGFEDAFARAQAVLQSTRKARGLD